MEERYVVTGGAGFIGSHLTERLVAEGHSVTVIDDFSTGNLANLKGAQMSPKVEVIASTVSGCKDLVHLVDKSVGIFHLAAAVGVELVIRSPIKTIRTNLDETEAILDAASQTGTPILIASTSEVYGKSENSEFSEEDDLLIGQPVLGRWSYACSKLMDEFLALAYAKERLLPVTIARIFNTVGPRQTGRYGMVLPRFISAAKKNEPVQVFGSGEQTRCFCFVADTVAALVTLLRTPGARGEVVNVGTDNETSINDLAQKVIELTHSNSAIERVPYAKAYGPGFEDMQRRKPSIAKLARLAGIRPSTSLDEIIRKTSA